MNNSLVRLESRLKATTPCLRIAAVAASISVVTCLSLSGCGTSNSLRKPVSGQVTVGAKRVESGVVSFFPTHGTSGPAATSLIRAGRYHFTSDNGPYAGHYQATITVDLTEANRSDGPRSPDPVPSSGNPSSHVDPKKRTMNQPLAGKRVSASKESDGTQKKWKIDCTVPANGSMEVNFELHP